MDPRAMCRAHLLGEHVECRMLRGSLRKGRRLDGFVESGLVDSRMLLERHEELAREMVRRGYRHASPLPADFDVLGAPGSVDVQRSMRELVTRVRRLPGRGPRAPSGGPWTRGLA